MISARRWSIVAVVVAAIIIVSVFAYISYGPPSNPSQATVSVGVLATGFHYFPFFVAVDRGIFKEAGINLNLSVNTFTDYNSWVAASVSGGVDIALSLADIGIRAVGIGNAPLVAVSGMGNGMTNWLLIKNGLLPNVPTCTNFGANCGGSVNQLKSIMSNLNGFKIGTFAAAGLDTTYLNKVIMPTYGNLQAGKNFTNVYLGANPSDYTAAFQRGDIDAAFSSPPYVAAPVAAGVAHVVACGCDFPGFGNYSFSVVMVRQPYLSAHSDIVNRFVKGIVQSIDWIKANPSAAIQEGQKIYSSLPPETVSSWLSAYRFSYSLAPSVMQPVIDFEQGLGILKTQVTYGKFVDTQFLPSS